MDLERPVGDVEEKTRQAVPAHGEQLYTDIYRQLYICRQRNEKDVFEVECKLARNQSEGQSRPTRCHSEDEEVKTREKKQEQTRSHSANSTDLPFSI